MTTSPAVGASILATAISQIDSEDQKRLATDALSLVQLLIDESGQGTLAWNMTFSAVIDRITTAWYGKLPEE